jgi:hypothetical protein
MMFVVRRQPFASVVLTESICAALAIGDPLASNPKTIGHPAMSSGPGELSITRDQTEKM